MSNQPTDPFAGGDSAPALAFPSPGTSYTIHVTETARLVQSRDFATGNPATWPDGNPKMAGVINGDVNGEPRSLWAKKPGALFTAIKEAQRAAGSSITPGGILTVTYTHDEAPKQAGMSGAKQFTAQYQPPNPFADDNAPAVAGVANPTNAQMLDAWAGQGTAQAPPSTTLPPQQTGPDLSVAQGGIPQAVWDAMTAEARAAVAGLQSQT